ncbi:ATP-binding cassette domain-containing protein [Hyphomicrobium sp.]|uniref:ATP-binding cassette domain-containing protein n=1 Tax=Hyphomicrobium sp. TaxID=82 RepID=UPI0025BD7C94|nr:ATP-binding cassette domain-containing protein [Hyphomicrobium sp.]MCC7252084.1 ATP-binding cassette domain-containing protein [Hyphomicrobium sp.]
MTALLHIHDVDVSAGDTRILHGIDLEIRAGEMHVLFGANGSGKSSLLAAIMGLPPFAVTRGEILLRGERIDILPVDERAKRGLGMAFQRPPALDGVTVQALADALGASEALKREADALDLGLGVFAGRDINAGFSGGEVKRWEILKLFLQQPTLLLFDEPESGVDLEHIASVGAAIGKLMRGGREPRSGLVITHTGFILDYIAADAGHIMADGRIIHSGEPRQLFRHIQRNGYTAPIGPAQAAAQA